MLLNLDKGDRRRNDSCIGKPYYNSVINCFDGDFCTFNHLVYTRDKYSSQNLEFFQHCQFKLKNSSLKTQKVRSGRIQIMTVGKRNLRDTLVDKEIF